MSAKAVREWLLSACAILIAVLISRLTFMLVVEPLLGVLNKPPAFNRLYGEGLLAGMLFVRIDLWLQRGVK